MAPRKTTKVTTTEEIENDPQGINPAQSLPEPEPDILPEPGLEEGYQEISDFYANLEPTQTKIKIWKEQGGASAYCGSAEPQFVNEDYLLKNYGAGKFTLKATFKGKFITGTNKVINLYEPPLTRADLHSMPVNTSADSQVQLLKEQVQRQHEMLMQVMQGNKAAPTSLAEIMQIVASMQQMTKPPDMMQVFPSLLGMFKETMEMARDAAGSGDGKTDWLGLAYKAMDKLPAIVSQIAQSRTPVVVNPQEKEETEDMKIDFALKQGIAYLKERAIKGKDPELQADMILDNFDEPQFRIVGTQLLNMAFEDFGKIDPDILNEPLRSWFKRVYDRLKEGLENEDEQTATTAGSGGSVADITGNEAGND